MKRNKQIVDLIDTRFRFLDMLHFVIWFGVLSGLTGITFLRMKGFVGGAGIYLRCHTMWMAPAVNVIILGIIGLVTLPVVMCFSRPFALRVTIVVLASVSFLSILCLESARTFSSIHFVPKVILAIGLAITLHSLISRRTLAFEQFVRFTTIPLVLLVMTVTAAVGGRRYFLEQRIIKELPNSPESAPNVLLIVLDTVRAESMSLYGYERETTPFLKSLAKEGIVFQRAISTSSWTFPSHVSMFTGRFRYETAEAYSTLGSKYPTLAEVLEKHGFITGGFVANTGVCSIESGLARGFIHYEDYVASFREFARSSSVVRFAIQKRWIRDLFGYYELLGRKPAPWITNDFLKWINNIPSNRPFFAFLNYLDAHSPYLPPDEFADKFGLIDKLYELRNKNVKDMEELGPAHITKNEIEAMRNAYDSTIAYLDNDLFRLFNELERREILDRTLIILVSDHGEEFGEHNAFGHGLTLYSKPIHVPLILRLPGIVPDHVVVHNTITLRDIPATIIEILGLPESGRFPGRSLSRYWNKNVSKDQVDGEFAFSELLHAPWEPSWSSVSKGDVKSLVIGNMHYIHNGDKTEEVYDLSDDLGEYNNLIKTPRGEDTALRAREIIEEIMH